MNRDIQDRLDMFGCADTTVERIALNMKQIEQYSPPPNPAKITDSRYSTYVSQYGNESWELDALDPKIIVALIQQHIDENTNQAQRRKILQKEKAYRKQLREIAEKMETE